MALATGEAGVAAAWQGYVCTTVLVYADCEIVGYTRSCDMRDTELTRRGCDMIPLLSAVSSTTLYVSRNPCAGMVQLQ